MRRDAFLLQLICGILASPGWTQNARVSVLPREPDRAAADNSVRISVDSNLVLVPVSVSDRWDRLVTGLGKESFRIYDDNIEQEIRHFASEDTPVSIALVFDASGSMESKLDKAKAALVEFVRESNPEDEFLLIEVHDHPFLLVPFTSDAGEIQNRLPLLKSGGRTALLDAICIALDEMKHARHSRKAIFIISDGGDNASRYHEREVKRRIREADVQIYSIGILAPAAYRWNFPDELSGPRLLSDIAGQTGGRFVEIGGLEELGPVAVKIGAALRNQYVLGYAPPARSLDGKAHRIIVRLEQADGADRWRATFRSSYVGLRH
jgi:Ca-activated chloride channel family protein